MASRPPLVPEGFPEVPQPQTATMLLAVSSRREDHVVLKQVFRDTNWELREARTYRDALMILCHDRMPVVICESCLPDGNWKDILSQVTVLPDAPRLIVTSREPDDRLWGEVLNMGGHDVLTTPFDKNELIRVVNRAWQSWEYESCRVNQRWRKPQVFAQSA
jgi:DNA-binding NtrC family response regulator